MASRYWVGGGSAGNWNSTVPTNWAATSGGANNASVPTAADDVFFDANSGVGTCTILSNVACHSIDMTGSTASITGSGSRTVGIGGAGNTGLGAAVCKLRGTKLIIAGVITLSFDNRSGGVTVTMLDGTGVGTWSCNTDTTHTNTVTIATDFSTALFNHQRGTLAIAATKTLTATTFQDGGTASAKSISMANATIACLGLAMTSTSNAMAITGDANSLITCVSYVLSGVAVTFPGTNAGKGVRVTPNAGAYTIPNSSCVFGRLTFIQPTEGSIFTVPITAGGVPTCTTLEFVGLSAKTRCMVQGNPSLTSGFSATNLELTNVDIARVTITGTHTAVITVAVGDCGGNSGITFTTPVTRYWVGDSGDWSDTAHWSATSGGSSGASVPLPQDASIVDNNSFSSAGKTITMDSAAKRFGSLDMSACTTYAHSIVFNAQTDIHYGANGNTILSPQTTATGTWGNKKNAAYLTFTQNGANCAGVGLTGRSGLNTNAGILAGSDLNVFYLTMGSNAHQLTSFNMNGFNFTAVGILISNGNFTVSSYKTITLADDGINQTGGQILTDGTADLVFSLTTGPGLYTSSVVGISGGNVSWRNVTANHNLTVSMNNTAMFTCETFIFNRAGAVFLTPRTVVSVTCKWIITNGTIDIGGAVTSPNFIGRGIVGEQIVQRATMKGVQYTGTSPDTITYAGPQSTHSGAIADVNVSLTNSPRVRSSVAIL